MPSNIKTEAEAPEIHFADVEEDKEMKKQLLIDIIASHCSESL